MIIEQIKTRKEIMMSAKEQIDKLANFIMAEIEGEPSRSEGAGDCAIRIIESMRHINDTLSYENAELKRKLFHSPKED